MPCYQPVHGYAAQDGSFTHIRKNARVRPRDLKPDEMKVPCGKCIGCRITRSKEWAIRIMHEASLHEDNSFLTLTYAPENLPRYGSLRPLHFTKFIKKLRHQLNGRIPEDDPRYRKIRYFMCGEYGEKLSRPHYHAVIFGYMPDDLVPFKRGVYTSPSLEKLWGHGYVTVGTVTFKSAAYIARYVTKKINGPDAERHYETVDIHTGEIHPVRPEYIRMSTRPGLGTDWFHKFHPDVYPHDYCIHEGKKIKTPRYYDRLLDRINGELLEHVKDARTEHALASEETPERLAVKQKVLEAKLTRLKREYETS